MKGDKGSNIHSHSVLIHIHRGNVLTVSKNSQARCSALMIMLVSILSIYLICPSIKTLWRGNTDADEHLDMVLEDVTEL